MMGGGDRLDPLRSGGCDRLIQIKAMSDRDVFI
jgi:hypothetical protein